MKTLVKCMAKTAKDSAKEATKRNKDQHILLKVQDIDLAAREAHYHATCQRASFLLVRNCDCDLCEVTLCG